MSEFAAAEVVKRGNQLHVKHGDDTGLFVEFEMRPIHMEAKSEAEGRPIYEDHPYIHIQFPGDRTKKICRPVKMKDDNLGPADPVRFPNQWAAFKNQQAQVQTGTPVEMWAPLTKSQAMELKAMSIHTVEALAALPDSAMTWLGSRELRQKAITWLSQAESGKEALHLQHELELRDQKIEDLQRQVRELAALGAKEGKAPRKGAAPQADLDE